MKRSICMAMLFLVFICFQGLGTAAYGQLTDADAEKTGKIIMKMQQAINAGDIDAAFKYADEMPDESKETMGMMLVFQQSLLLKRCDIAKKSYSQIAEILRTIHKVNLLNLCP